MKNLTNFSSEQLKAHLKAIGMSQSGDKGTLLHRAQLHEKCSSKKLVVDGENPCLLRIGDLRKAVSMNGLSPIGSQDELLTSLVNHLETLSNSKPVEPISNQRGTDIDPVAIARRILDLDENDDYEGILSLAGCGPISKSSPFQQIRKAYLKLSLIVHPDKLGSTFDQATKSFQALVRAVERLSMQDITTDETENNKTSSKTSTTKTTTKTISRSNEGCFRTRVCCPRCKQPWSEGSLDGNPEYFYNFLMMGLKQYTCSTCLFEFGCLTAIHKCPFCKSIFEYSPQDYHRQIKCGKASCQKLFGFYLFNTSDRVMKEMKKEVKEEMERRARAKEAKQRRANKHRHNDLNEEAAFMMGLSDCCPRCGESLEDYSDEDAQRQHLMNCTDESKHKAHKDEKAKREKKQVEKELRQEKQDSAQTRAAWEFLGAQTNQLWLLDDSQLQAQAVEAGIVLEAGADRDDFIAAIASHRSVKEDISGVSQFAAITDGSTSNVSRGPKRSRLTAETVPSNLHTMSVRELRAVCAAHGFKPVGKSKGDILAEIEEELCAEHDTDPKRLRIGNSANADVVDLT